MLKALKTFGIGLIYILLSPLIVVAAAFYAAFGLLYGVFYTFVLISRFFRGKKLFPPFEEDLIAEENINRAYEAKAGIKEEGDAKPSNVYVQQNYYQAPQNQNPYQGQLPPNYGQNAFPQFPQMDQNNPYGQMNPRLSRNPTQETPRICSYDEDGNPLDEDGLPILMGKEGDENE